MFRVLSYIGELYERKKWEWRKFPIKIAPNSKVYFFIDTLYKQKLRLLLCFIRVFFVFRVFLFLWNSTLWFLFLLPIIAAAILFGLEITSVCETIYRMSSSREVLVFFFFGWIYMCIVYAYCRMYVIWRIVLGKILNISYPFIGDFP